MIYREDKYGNKISQLGYGCMRFEKNGYSINYKKAEEEVLKGIELGINYYDTAYMYPGSEEVLGKILSENNVRDKVNIATKLPHYMLNDMDAINKVFAEQLKRLKTDYIDYYLFHMFTDVKEWDKLKELDIENWIAEHKKNGSIKYIGFSYHGDTDMFLKILNAYDWDFCQIQYNYVDEHTQAGLAGLYEARKKGIPVIIMEPLRGGKLVKLPEEAMDVIKNSDRGYSAAEWGLRWLYNQNGILCVLSGMNSLEMVEENARIASEAEIDTFTENDFKIIEKIKNILNDKVKVPCTGCKYCMPCPKGVDIPGNFHYYNLCYVENKKEARFEYARNLGLRDKPGFASSCVKCGKCEEQCPQHIKIREKLVEADKELRPLPYKIGINIARKFVYKKKKR